MASKKPTSIAEIKEEETLAKAVLEAQRNAVPQPLEAEQALIPQLLSLLSPRWVSATMKGGDSKPKVCLREPILLVSWDRAAGRWRVSVSDKILDFSVTWHVVELAQLILESERAIQEGKVLYKSLET